MKCANPDCDQYSDDLREGRVCLVEKMVAPEERITGSEGGFPVCVVPSRYFWLCGNCSSGYFIRGWLEQELILEPRISRTELHAAYGVKRMPIRVSRQRSSTALAQKQSA